MAERRNESSAAQTHRWRYYVAALLAAVWGSVVTLGGERFGSEWLAFTIGYSLLAVVLVRWVRNGE